MDLIGFKFQALPHAAQVVVRQAQALGYAAWASTAETGTIYIEIAHPTLCECDDADCGGDCDERLIRVADHAPNEARYMGRNAPNREPDLFVGDGAETVTPIGAVAVMAEWIGAPEPACVKAARTRARNNEVKAAAAAEARRQTELAVRQQRDDMILATLTAEQVKALKAADFGDTEAVNALCSKIGVTFAWPRLTGIKRGKLAELADVIQRII